MSIAFALAAVAAGACAVSFEVESPQTRVRAGEPLKLVLRVKVTADNWGMDLAEPGGSLRFLVRSRQSEKLFRAWQPSDYTGGVDDSLLVLPTFAKGTLLRLNVVAWLGTEYWPPEKPGESPGTGEPTPLLPRRGRYTISLVYGGSGGSTRCVSNALAIEVDAATAEGQAAVQEVLDIASSAARGWRWPMLPKSDALGPWVPLLQQQPDSPYLRTMRLRWLEARCFASAANRDATSGPRAVVSELLSGGWGVFEEDALGVAHSCARRVDDGASLQTIDARLLERFQNSPTVEWLRLGGELGQPTPPAGAEP